MKATAAHPLAKRFMGYLLTGGLAAVVDLGVFALLEARGLSVPVAALMSFVVAMLANYALSARYVFHHAYSWRGLGAFAAGASAGLVVNTGVTTLGYYLTGMPIVAKVIGIGVAFVFNFAINALVVFRTPKAR